jgi:NADP-dependent 3-hydroxy acid dehydrogenase YdfG
VLTQDLLPLVCRCQGQVVFMNSTAGLTSRANVSQCAGTKHALEALADSLREEVNRNGVRVLSVFPGRTASPSQEHLQAQEGRLYRPERLLQPEDVAAVVVHALCLPRTAEVTEIKIRPMLNSD